jgi:hypothetical protein
MYCRPLPDSVSPQVRPKTTQVKKTLLTKQQLSRNLGVHVCVRAAVSLGGFFSLESSLVLLEEILSLDSYPTPTEQVGAGLGDRHSLAASTPQANGGPVGSWMCTLVTAHGAPIGLGSGRSERMPIT